MHKLSYIDKQMIVVSFFRDELVLVQTIQLKLLNLAMLLLLDPSQSVNLLPILKDLPHLLFNYYSLFVEHVLQEQSGLSLKCPYLSHVRY